MNKPNRINIPTIEPATINEAEAIVLPSQARGRRRNPAGCPWGYPCAASFKTASRSLGFDDDPHDPANRPGTERHRH